MPMTSEITMGHGSFETPLKSDSIQTAKDLYHIQGDAPFCTSRASKTFRHHRLLDLQIIFVIDFPKELVLLAKLSPDDPPARTKPLRRGKGPTTVEVFECCINGREIAPWGAHAPRVFRPAPSRVGREA